MRLVEDTRLGVGLSWLPAYILQGATNLSPQVSLDWPGSESSTVQSREDEEGKGRGGRGREGWESTALTRTQPPPPSDMYSDWHKSRLELHTQIMSHGNKRDGFQEVSGIITSHFNSYWKEKKKGEKNYTLALLWGCVQYKLYPVNSKRMFPSLKMMEENTEHSTATLQRSWRWNYWTSSTQTHSCANVASIKEDLNKGKMLTVAKR